MSSADFGKFADSVTGRRSDGALSADVPAYQRVTVLGGGADARLLAALCLSEGADVTLFSAYGAELDQIRQAGGITIRGEGPVGTYQVDQAAVPSVKTTAELDRAVKGAELIFLTGPVHKQRTYAMVLADHLADGQTLVLAPGRSLGAVETAWLLRVGGVRADVTLIEVQGLPYWTNAQGSVLHLTRCGPAPAAALPSGRAGAVAGLKRFFPNLVETESIVQSGFADGSGLVEVPALLIGGPACPDGQTDIPDGAKRLAERETFRSLIGPRHEQVIAAMAAERRAVASRFGVRGLPDDDAWLDVNAGEAVGPASRPIPDEGHAVALVRCAVVGSLVPLVSAARLAGISVPVTEAMVTLAGAALGGDLASAGRRLDAIGVTADTIDDARRIIDAIAKGER
ncbi:hypothetical protein [Microbaculum marinum]|uniref:Opine dehydrogenase domain-containing protein n=1 Tax=Microbaculum marinum TaxID=1764581 RepID=A0AAW9RIY7_9HYPH